MIVLLFGFIGLAFGVLVDLGWVSTAALFGIPYPTSDQAAGALGFFPCLSFAGGGIILFWLWLTDQ